MTFNGAQKELFNYTDLIIANGEKEIASAYVQAFKEVDSQLKNLYLKIQAEGIPATEYYNYMTKYKRLEMLRESIASEYQKAFNKAKRITENNNLTVMTEMFYRKNYLLQWAKPASQLFTILDDRVIQQAVYGTAETWGRLAETYGLQRGYVPQAGTLLDTLRKNNIDDLTRIQRTLTQQFIQGTSYAKTSRAFRDLFGGLSYNSERVARTEGTRVMNAGGLASTEYARSKGVEIVRTWLATIDSKTRETHVSADGKRENEEGLFTVGGATGPYPGNMSSAAESINCRCTVLENVDGVSPQLRRATNPLTGESEIIEFTDYESYMKSKGMKKTIKGWVKE